MRGGRWPANLATLANLLVGIGAVLYVLAGNPLWAMLLITSGVGFDGLDGFLARKAGLGPSRFGRIADSIADATTFGIAPAALLIVHTDHAELWRPLASLSWGVGILFAALSIARLVYFTLRGYQNPDFLGAPTPQSALALLVFTLFVGVPASSGSTPPSSWASRRSSRSSWSSRSPTRRSDGATRSGFRWRCRGPRWW